MSNLKNKQKPDWEGWQRYGDVYLWEALCFSLNIEAKPNLVFRPTCSESEPPFLIDELNKRYLEIKSWMPRSDCFEYRANPKAKTPLGVFVDPNKFCSWCLEHGFNVPKEFAFDRKYRGNINTDNPTVVLPYDCRFINMLSEIMFNNYIDIPDSGPNQTKVALEIDEKIGWKNQKKNEKASRPAIAIAAVLQPEKYQKQ